MKKIFMALVALACMVGGFAKPFKGISTIKGIQNEIIVYAEGNPEYTFENFKNYAEYVATNDIVCFYFTREEESRFYEKLKESKEGSWLRYFDAAWHKYTYASKAFGEQYSSKKFEKKFNKIVDGKTCFTYHRVVFNAGEIFCDGETNSKPIQWEVFAYMDENTKFHFLYVWQGSKNNDPKEFITFLE